MQISCNDNANTDPGRRNPLGTSSAEMLDNKEIDNSLQEFGKLLSDYSCDGNPADPVTLSSAHTRLESFVSADRTDNPSRTSSAGPQESAARLSESIGSAAKENPGASARLVEDEASVR